MKKLLSWQGVLIIIFTVFLISALAYIFFISKNPPPSSLANISLANIDPRGEHSLFSDSHTWPSSDRVNPEDRMMQMLEMMIATRTDVDEENFAVASQFIDFNGDGLSDFLYFYYTVDYHSFSGERGYLALKNNGDYTFDTAYKCKWYSSGSSHTFYGDCALDSGVSPSEFQRRYFPEGKYLPALFFEDHRDWPHSVSGRQGDTTRQLLNALNTTANPFNTPISQYERGFQFVDLNGDGLVDFLFFQKEENLSNEQFTYDSDQYVILINQGDFTLEPEYKCYTGDPYYYDSGWHYAYGDCVSL